MARIFPKSNSCKALYKHRPLRIAFIIDPENISEDLLNNIIEFCLESWAGRYYPIIPCDGSTIPESYWNLLNFSDPDFVYSYVELSQEIIEKIDRLTTPIGFYQNLDDRFLVSEKPLSNRFLVKRIPKLFSFLFYNADKTLSVIKLDKKNENYNFVLRNFGYLNYLLRSFSSSTKQTIELDKICDEIETYCIDGNNTLKVILECLNKKSKLIHPILLSEIGGDASEISWKEQRKTFTIGVGDSLNTYLYLWNNIHISNEYFKKNLSYISISNVILNDVGLFNSVMEFVDNYIFHDNYNNYDVRIISADKSKSEIEDIASLIKSNKNWRICIGPSKEDFSFPEFKYPTQNFQFNKQYDDIKFFDDITTLIPNKNPIFDDRSSPQAGKWMIDIDLSYRPELFDYTNKDYWWKLPNKKGLSSLFSDRPSKVNKQGAFSFLVESGLRNIKIQIPTERAIFYQLIVPYYGQYYTSDIREKKTPKYNRISLSDKGKYLSGVLDLCPSLFHAYECFCSNFWRTIFKFLANIQDKRQENQLLLLKNKIKKYLALAINDFAKHQDQVADKLAYYTYTLFHQEKDEMLADFDRLFNLAKQEYTDFMAANSNRDDLKKTEEEIKRELKEAVQDLLDSKILFQGIRPKCHYCGFNNWFDLNEIQTELTCKGCHSKFTCPAEPKWFYKLNELIKGTIIHQGVMATLLCLGHLFEESRESFIFYPNIELFEKDKDKNPSAEIDLICISDGQFIIGEVKNSAKLFSKNDFDKIEKIALEIHPDKVIFYALEGPFEKVEQYTKDLQKKLSKFCIDVHFIKPRGDINSPSYHLNPF
jgi:hypothetical protein